MGGLILDGKLDSWWCLMDDLTPKGWINNSLVDAMTRNNNGVPRHWSLFVFCAFLRSSSCTAYFDGLWRCSLRKNQVFTAVFSCLTHKAVEDKWWPNTASKNGSVFNFRVWSLFILSPLLWIPENCFSVGFFRRFLPTETDVFRAVFFRFCQRPTETGNRLVFCFTCPGPWSGCGIAFCCGGPLRGHRRRPHRHLSSCGGPEPITEQREQVTVKKKSAEE